MSFLVLLLSTTWKTTWKKSFSSPSCHKLECLHYQRPRVCTARDQKPSDHVLSSIVSITQSRRYFVEYQISVSFAQQIAFCPWSLFHTAVEIMIVTNTTPPLYPTIEVTEQEYKIHIEPSKLLSICWHHVWIVFLSTFQTCTLLNFLFSRKLWLHTVQSNVLLYA